MAASIWSSAAQATLRRATTSAPLATNDRRTGAGAAGYAKPDLATARRYVTRMVPRGVTTPAANVSGTIPGSNAGAGITIVGIGRIDTLVWATTSATWRAKTNCSTTS